MCDCKPMDKMDDQKMNSFFENLIKTCVKCGGFGSLLVFTNNSKGGYIRLNSSLGLFIGDTLRVGICEDCDGKGSVMSTYGTDLLLFLEKYWVFPENKKEEELEGE